MNCEKVSREIIDWLTDYNNNEAKTKGFIVGVSGGVDSALVSTLCAMTGIETTLIEMPINRKQSSIPERSENHCKWLVAKYSNVSWYKEDLSLAYNSFVNGFKIKGTQLADANTASRCRMVTLFYYANTFDCLVVGTGNKIEDGRGIGFCTVGGDLTVSMNPIGDLMKSEVRELASFLGVSEDIVKAIPTDELWGDTRSDEDQIGASYDDLEWAMKVLESLNGGQKMFVKKYIKDHGNLEGACVNIYEEMSCDQKKVFNIFMNRHVKNEFKNNVPPICYISEKD